MRILQVVADGNAGGGTIHVLQLLSGLSGPCSFRLVTQKNSYLLEQATRLGIPASGLDFFRSRIDPVVPLRMRQIIRDFGPDAVHIHGSRAGFFSALSFAGSPLVYSVHGYHFVGKSWFTKSLAVNAERLIARNASHVIFVSRHDARMARQWKLLGQRTEASVVYPGISLDGIPQAEPKERKQVGFIGRLVDQKDPLLFIDVVEQLPDYSATIVGGGPLEHAVRAEVGRRKLRQVKMLGSLPHLEALQALSQFGVLVLTSKWEGLPILALEAMWAGVPVVTTDAGGVNEAIEDGRCGIVVDSRSPEKIALAVREVTEDLDFRGLIIKNARERVQTLFSEDRMLAQIQKVYDQLAGQSA